MHVSAPTKGEQTRTTILQSAHDLFIKQGYHGTSMRQIAQGAHIALGGLYNHFSSKEQVFEAVFFSLPPLSRSLPPDRALPRETTSSSWYRMPSSAWCRWLKGVPIS